MNGPNVLPHTPLYSSGCTSVLRINVPNVQAKFPTHYVHTNVHVEPPFNQAKFLTHYVHNGILPRDPFETLDEDGVGEMVGGGES